MCVFFLTKVFCFLLKLGVFGTGKAPIFKAEGKLTLGEILFEGEAFRRAIRGRREKKDTIFYVLLGKMRAQKQ